MATAVAQDRATRIRLFQAAKNGDISALEKAIQESKDPETMTASKFLTICRNDKKRSVLHLACQSTNHSTTTSDDENQPAENDIVKLLLQKKEWFPDDDSMAALLKQKDIHGMTPLMLAVQHSDPATAHRRVTHLLAHSSSLALARSKAGATALHYAAAAATPRQPDTLRELHNAAKVAVHTFSTNQGGTPLHWACSVPVATNEGGGSNLSTINTLLLECGADVNAHQWVDEHETQYAIPPPIVLAAAAKNDLYCQRLLQCGNVDWNISIAPGDHTLLHLFAKSNSTESLQTLFLKKVVAAKRDLAASSLLEKKNADGMTPLDVAVKEGHIECVRLLLAASKNIDVSVDEAATYVAQSKSTSETTTTVVEKKTALELTTQNKLPQPTCDVEIKAQQKALSILSDSNKATATEESIRKALEQKTEGNQHFVKKDWQQAYNLYSLAMEMNPSEVTLYTNRSSCLWNLWRPEESLEDAFIARTLRPDWSKACYRLALARLSMDYYQEAAVAAWEGLQLDPNNKELKVLLQKCVVHGRERFRNTKEHGETND